MKYKKMIAAALALATVSINGYASTTDIKAANSQIGIQAISTNVNYTETGNGLLGTATGTVDTENGNVPGYNISASVMKDLWLGNDYIEAQYSHNSGNTTYVGALQGGTYGSVVGMSSATLLDYSARYGKGMDLSDAAMATPYIELGHHEWDRGVNYGETYTHNYVGLGVLGQYSPVGKLVFTGNLMVGNTFGSNIDVAAGPGVGGFSGALGNASLYKAGLSADYAFTQHFHANIGIDHTSFKYGMSSLYPVNGLSWEPDSKTSYTTTSIGIGYAF